MGEEVQDQEKHWEDQSLKHRKKALPPLKVDVLMKAAAGFKESTGVGVDGFHSGVPLDLTDKCCEIAVNPANRAS